MALAQSIATPYGVDATYWTISRITIDRVNLVVDLTLAGYANEEAEKSLAQPLLYKGYQVFFKEEQSITSSIEDSGIPTQAITPELIGIFETISKFGYSLAKQSKEFNSALDI